MGAYAYKARNRAGELVTGTIEGDSPDRVAEHLFGSGITPVEIRTLSETVGRRIAKGSGGWFQRRVQPEEIVMLCRQLRTLLKAGVPILRGLSGLAETTRSPQLAYALRDVYQQLQSGREFNVALAQHPRIFSPLFVSLVRIGESTGKLDESFAQLASYLELEERTRDRVKSALRYPLIVLLSIAIAVGVINVWVIPAFADAFASYGAELPLMTRILIATSEFTVAYWTWILAALVVGWFGLGYWARTEKGKLRWSQWLLQIPLVGPIVKKSLLGRFSHALSMTIKSGVPLVHGLSVIADVVDNAYVAEKMSSMRDGIAKGDSIARVAAATGLFTPLVLQMISVGEETGAVDDLLAETAEHYQNEVEYELKALSDAIEPIVIVVIGVLVTVLALGVFLPLWDLSSAARG
jgi:MSHA biogenesis protein MshG